MKAGSQTQASIHCPLLFIVGAALFLCSCGHVYLSPEESGKLANFCSQESKPLKMEFEFSVAIMPPPGTPIESVENYVSDTNLDIEILKKSFVWAIFVPTSEPPGASSGWGKLGTFKYSQPEVSYLTAGAGPDGFYSAENFSNLSLYAILKTSPPYQIAICPAQHVCLNKVEPLTKSPTGSLEFRNVDEKVWHHGNGSEGSEYVPSLVRIAMQLIADSGIKPPGDYLNQTYFSATPEDLSKMGISPNSRDRTSAAILNWVIQNRTSVSERMDGNWKVISIKFNPSELCKYARSRSELLTK